MECLVCNVRSSVTFCTECQALLCEACGATCNECSKPICPKHTQVSRSGRVLCTQCHAEYLAKTMDGASLFGAPVESALRRRRQEQVWQPPPVWKFSLYTGIVGVIAVLVAWLVPYFQVIDLGAIGRVPSLYIVMVIPVIAIAWAITGLLSRREIDGKWLNAVGLLLGLASVGLGFYGIQKTVITVEAPPPTRLTERLREELSPEERAEWRREMLERYNR